MDLDPLLPVLSLPGQSKAISKLKLKADNPKADKDKPVVVVAVRRSKPTLLNSEYKHSQEPGHLMVSIVYSKRKESVWL